MYLDTPTSNRRFQAFVAKATIRNYNLSLVDVAEKIGVSLPTLRNWIAGKTSPHPRLRPSIVQVLNTLIYSEMVKSQMTSGPMSKR